jgi:hypothetical protein
MLLVVHQLTDVLVEEVARIYLEFRMSINFSKTISYSHRFAELCNLSFSLQCPLLFFSSEAIVLM